MKKIIFAFFFSLGFIFSIEAQVKFKISALGDGETFLISAIPERTFIAPLNNTGSAQITLRLDAKSRFTAGNITSLQTDVKWIDNVYLEKPKGDSMHNYVSIALSTLGTKGLKYEQGKELPLFTFKNIGTSCSGYVELVDNDALLTQNVVNNGLNIGNHLKILGDSGESFAGLIPNATSVACAQAFTGVNTPSELSMVVFPVPVKVELHVEWKSSSIIKDGNLTIINAVGELVSFQKINDAQSAQTIDVQNLATGMYMVRLSSNNTVLLNRSFVVAR